MCEKAKKALSEIAIHLKESAKILESLCECSEEKKEITLEEVRSLLAQKSRDGFTKEVRELLSKYKVSKLSDVNPEDYEALMKDARGLGDE